MNIMALFGFFGKPAGRRRRRSRPTSKDYQGTMRHRRRVGLDSTAVMPAVPTRGPGPSLQPWRPAVAGNAAAVELPPPATGWQGMQAPQALREALDNAPSRIQWAFVGPRRAAVEEPWFRESDTTAMDQSLRAFQERFATRNAPDVVLKSNAGPRTMTFLMVGAGQFESARSR